MEELDYWRLCDELTIVQAALLACDGDILIADTVESLITPDQPVGYAAARHAICTGLENHERFQEKNEELQKIKENQLYDTSIILDEHIEDEVIALKKRSISGTLIPIGGAEYGFLEAIEISGLIDVHKSTVNADSLRDWLRFKGVRTGFFFPEPQATMDFLDPLNPRYAPKLAAAVTAWQSVTEAGKKSPKQALDKWLREHAVKFGLTNDDGNPIDQAIEECSKVANWNPRGGATKTPS